MERAKVLARAKDQIDIRSVQLKSGVASLTGGASDRLCSAVEHVNVEGLAALATAWPSSQHPCRELLYRP